MGTRVVIVGAGGFGRNMYRWLLASPKHIAEASVSELVFVDDGIPSVAPPTKLICTIDDYGPEANDEVLLAIGVPSIRQQVKDRLDLKGCRYHTFLADESVVTQGTLIGNGVIVCPGSVVAADVTLGDHVHMNMNCSVGHDVKIGAMTTLSPAVNIMGEVWVGEAVFFGGSSVVLPRISVGDKALLGAGAVAICSVPSEATVVGNPARIISRETTFGK